MRASSLRALAFLSLLAGSGIVAAAAAEGQPLQGIRLRRSKARSGRWSWRILELGAFVSDQTETLAFFLAGFSRAVFQSL